MANPAIEFFNFYYGYLWRDTDFANFQSALIDWTDGGREGLSGAACVSGLQVIPNSGMTVTVKAGIGISPSGKLLVLENDTDVTVVSPSGNPAKTYLVLRLVPTDENDIPTPTNPSVMVPLNEAQTAEVVEIDGTPAPSPVYPSLGADDLVLMGFGLTNGQVNLTISSFEVTKRNNWSQNRVSQITQVTSNYTVADNDEIIEVNATGGAVTISLPAANLSVGRRLTIVKTDSSSNVVTVDGDSTELICGQTSFPISDQFGFASIYANGVGWNQIA